MAGNGKRNCDEALIAALAAGGSVTQAATLAQVSERTVYRRLADPAFRTRVDEARTTLVRQTIGRLSALGEASCATLEALLGNERASVQLGAVRTVLEFMFRGHDIDTIARQIDELKVQVEQLCKVKPTPAWGYVPPAESRGTAADPPAEEDVAPLFETSRQPRD